MFWRTSRFSGRRRLLEGPLPIRVLAIVGLWLGARAANRDLGRSWILIGFAIQATAMSIHFAATHHQHGPVTQVGEEWK